MLLLIHSLLLLWPFLQHVLADPPVVPSEQADVYDLGLMGRVPLTRLKSTKGVASQLLRRTWDPVLCDRPDQYYFIGIHGILVGHAGPEIIDNDGHQVWFGKGYQATYNFRVQTWRGEQYLTWWSGHDQVRGHGEGYYYMLDKNYQLFKKIGAIGEGKMGDLHEFQFTEQGTAILTIYQTIPYNLTDWGVEGDNGTTYIRECLFQEIDIETNELLFEWRASEHILLEDCYTHPSGEGKSFANAWDWFHINSVEKDAAGNYLISSRYAHALYYISGETSEILWQLGGKKNNFTDLSPGGQVISIKRQHHARWADDQTAITVFDNGEKNKSIEDLGSRGLKFSIDMEAMTVDVMAEAYHPLHYFSASQGSVQQLDNGNLLVGWGYAPAFTEFSPDGEKIVCDMQFAALHAGSNSSFSPGALESYRVFQHPWKGYPLDPPDVAFVSKDRQMYVSWNGATEVRGWVLEGAHEFDDGVGEFEFVTRFAKQGFESNAEVDSEAYAMFRLSALDKNGELLGSWAVSASEATTTSLLLNPSSTATTLSVWTPVLLALIGSAILLSCKVWLSRSTLKWPEVAKDFPHLQNLKERCFGTRVDADVEAAAPAECVGLVADHEKSLLAEKD